MNIYGTDVEALFKFFQVHPQLTGLEYEVEFDLKSQTHGLYTIKRCRSLEYFERHREDKILKYVCEVIDTGAMETTARLFNPNMVVTPLKLPPRENRDEVACVWKFEIKENAPGSGSPA
jgi:hypothetical protein